MVCKFFQAVRRVQTALQHVSNMHRLRGLPSWPTYAHHSRREAAADLFAQAEAY